MKRINLMAPSASPMNNRRAFHALLWFLLCGVVNAAPVRIFFDTDMETDCDDAGAMAVLHTLADRGECEILATVTSVRDVNSIATVDAINRYRGRPNLPLGMVKGAGVLERSKFAAQIAREFPHSLTSAESVPDAVKVYRDVLAKQPDHSVIIVTVGYLTNLRGLLRLPASDGLPGGMELIKAKVAKWVCMGGNFIGHPPRDDLKLGNVNFQRDAVSAYDVVHHWPTEIVFAGREVCSVPSGLMVGEALASTPGDNPVRRAYEHYFGGSAKNRHVADLATVLYAVRGLTDCWDASAPGRMDLRQDMTFDWLFEAEGKMSYLLKRPNNDRHVEAVLNGLLLGAAPAR
jgi:Inosine-uridine preferring nucleoside hydrolase